MLFGVKVGKMDAKKHSKNIPAKKSCTKFGKSPCVPLREQIQGSQDWQPNQGIRDTPLVPAGTVADILYRPTIDP